MKRGLTPEAAVDRLEYLYGRATSALTTALDRYLETKQAPSAAERAAFRYPLLRLSYREEEQLRPLNYRAFAKLQRPGVYETTITHPGPFRSYLLEQLVPLAEEYGARFDVGISGQEIPYPYVLERVEELARAGVTSVELARHFPTPHLAEVGVSVARDVSPVCSS